MMQLRPYQSAAKEAVLSQWQNGHRRTLIVLPTGCHAIGEKLLMADGKACAVEDINVGDHLMGANGTPRTVLHKMRGHGALYRIIPVKGEPFVVSHDHRLTLIRTNERKSPRYPSQCFGGEMIDVTIDEWLSWSRNRKHLYKLVRCSGIAEFEASERTLPIDPYFLGILLGDGDLCNVINVTTPDAEVAEMLYNEAQRYDMTLRAEPAGLATTYYFVGHREGRKGTILRSLLKAVGVYGKGAYEKSVPFAYKTAPISARLSVIAGLIDSDGRLAGNGYDFTSASETLANDIAFLCRSVGLAAYIRKCTKSCGSFTGTYFRVSISGNCSIIPCRVSRKKALSRRQIKDVLRTGFTVEPVEDGDYIGFTVDGDNRYLLDDFTITHNCGKTIVFSAIAAECVRQGKRVLIMAHRGELLQQAADKLKQATGLSAAFEKAEATSIGMWERVVVGSVQTLMRDSRLEQFSPGYFDTIIIDEAHHCLSDSYQRVLAHFPDADILGVTATPDRSDMRDLGTYFDSLAYEYSLPMAIRDKYLVPIKALTIPLKLDMRGVRVTAGDFQAGDLGDALEPYLERIADEMVGICAGRKAVVFLPLVKTSQKFRDILCAHGMRAAEINGESTDRAEVLRAFEKGEYDVLCNSMLLTEGWDCPAVDCIVILRPTKSRSLYCQMAGRGTRLAPGKDHLLLLDFLWLTQKHELCRPAALIAGNEDVARAMIQRMEDAPGRPMDIEAVEKQASQDVVMQREAALAKQLSQMRARKRKLVDPLQFEMSIQAEDLSSYIPAFGDDLKPPTAAQLKALEHAGIFPDEIDSQGKAEKLLDRLNSRRLEGLATPKQIRFLEGRGFQHVGTWQFESARRLIDRIAANGWKMPRDITPGNYMPETGE